MAFEKLHLPFVPLGCFKCVKRSEIAAFARARISLPRIKPVFTGFQSLYHDLFLAQSMPMDFLAGAGKDICPAGDQWGKMQLYRQSQIAKRPSICLARRERTGALQFSSLTHAGTSDAQRNV
jgi:hypothetical protein